MSEAFPSVDIQATHRETTEWAIAHEQLTRLAKARAIADAIEGRWLLRALRARTHVHLGFGGFNEYIETLFGYKPRSTEEKLRVAEALESLPRSLLALSEGRVRWSALRELTRIMTPETECEWLTVAAGRSIREIERAVSGHTTGDLPSSPTRREHERHVLRFEVSSETLAVFRDALTKLRRNTGTRLDDDAALLLVARHVLGGPTDEGQASYQVAVTICEACGGGFQQGSGELISIGPEIAEMASCDAQRIGSAHEPVSGAHVGVTDRDLGELPRRQRAKQNVPPAVRRGVMRRDHGCCVVPGCKNHTFTDVHHLELRSEGGDHHPDNLIVVCAAHHRALHRGTLAIGGRPSSGLIFTHADGTRYGEFVAPGAVDAQGKAFVALRTLGFREKEVRHALARVRTANAHSGADTETVLRAALAVLTSKAA